MQMHDPKWEKTGAGSLLSCAQVPSLGPVKAAVGYPNKKPYLHLACALWTPEILISDPEGMRGPKLDALRQHRVELVCAICKQAGGAVM